MVSREIAIDPVFANVLAGRGTDREDTAKPTAAAIIQAAEKLFLELGYHATRVSEVARDAHVSIGSIYVHYESKEGLYGAVVERALDIEERYVDAALLSEELNDLEKIITLGEAYVQFFRDFPGHFRLLMMPSEPIPEEATGSEVARRVAARGDRQRKLLAEVIARCIDQGLVQEGIDAPRAANFWWATWNGVIGLSLRSDDLAIDEDEMERVMIAGRMMLAEGFASAVVRDGDGRLLPEIRERLERLDPPSVSSPV